MRVLVLTSCTGQKSVTPPDALTLADFERGGEHVAEREATLPGVPAEDLYTGQQHVRLLRGVEAVRSAGIDIDLHVVSAGYGVVPSERPLAPYEVTFQGMKAAPLRAWADRLGIPAAVRALLAEPYDLALVLLGDAYLKAADLAGADAFDDVSFGGPTLLFCGRTMARRLPDRPDLHVVPLSNPEAKRFSCGLVGLKGELTDRLLQLLAAGTHTVEEILAEPLTLADERGSDPAPTRRSGPEFNPTVDRVIHVPQRWWDRPHQRELRYFIPEWDDLVDPDYDFLTDTHSGGTGDWSNEVYAHQLYDTPNYDGILISKVVAEKSKKKKKRINEMGVHRYLRVPDAFPIIGDCGAFDYIKEEEPPYTTAEIIDYYTRLGFNYGVSVDHLIVKATEDAKQFRYDLTIENAGAFIREHRAQELPWTPIGAVQGWDTASYAEAARQLVAMGYTYLGIGGLVRSKTEEVGRIVEAVQEVVPTQTRIHLFGIARLNAMRTFADLGVSSVDSASALRRAWLGSNDNYWTIGGEQYAAIRIPEAGKSFRAKRIVQEGRASAAEVERLEQACCATVRGYARREASLADAIDALDAFDHLITPDRDSMIESYAATLEARPWENCPCAICQRDGVEVIIFRGNNRNRRRGFHNTWVFHEFFRRALAGEHIHQVKVRSRAQQRQTQLFESA